jgi:uncharacterized membrane protein YhaH (DUF805 family)
MNWYLEVLKKYATFGGRARRTEFWMFVLINFIINAVLNIVQRSTGSTIVLVISVLYSLAVLIPGIAVTVRRLHDTGRSGGWWFIVLIPIVGAIILIVFCAQDGQPGPNQYGPNPKQINAGPEPAWPGAPVA